MERLTKRLVDGNITSNIVDYGEPPYPIVTNDFVRRLAEYEDIGLTPQEIEQMKAQMSLHHNMHGKYKIITLCGSTKFKNEFMEVQKKLTLDGYIVISVGLFGHSGDNEAWSEGMKEMLDDMHKRKIDMSDEIFVINVDGYIGSSTKSEIEYAESRGLPVKYYINP